MSQEVKADVVRRAAKPTFAHSRESWTINERQRSKMNSTETRFLKRKRNKTRLDRIRNEAYGDELKMETTEVMVQRRQVRWIGHVARVGEGRLARKVYEAKEDGKRKRGRKNVRDKRIKMGGRKEGKRARTERFKKLNSAQPHISR